MTSIGARNCCLHPSCQPNHHNKLEKDASGVLRPGETLANRRKYKSHTLNLQLNSAAFILLTTGNFLGASSVWCCRVASMYASLVPVQCTHTGQMCATVTTNSGSNRVYTITCWATTPTMTKSVAAYNKPQELQVIFAFIQILHMTIIHCHSAWGVRQSDHFWCMLTAGLDTFMTGMNYGQP